MQINPKRLSNNCLTDTKSNERPPTLTLLRKKETIHHFIYSVPILFLTAKKTQQMNYQPDPPQLFSFDGRLALLIKMGIPETPIYHEPGRPEKNSPHTKTKQTYASLKESCGRSGGPKSTNRASPLRNQTFLICFCTKLHAFIFLMHAYYACHDQHEHH